MKPALCVQPGCVRPGVFVSARGPACGSHYGMPAFSPSDAAALMGRLVPHGTSYRNAIIRDGARLLLGEPGLPNHPRASYIRGASLGYLREAGKSAARSA